MQLLKTAIVHKQPLDQSKTWVFKDLDVSNKSIQTKSVQFQV